jgi:hypothetical protein
MTELMWGGISGGSAVVSADDVRDKLIELRRLAEF